MSLQVVVIGAGLAGTAVASCLSQKVDARVDIKVIDEGAQWATGASGNPAGVVLPHIAIESNPTTQFSRLGFEYLQSHLQKRGLDLSSGLLCLIRDSQERRRLERVFGTSQVPPFGARLVDSREASALAGIEIKSDGVFYPHHGWVSPRQICEVNAQAVSCVLNTSVHSLTQDGNGRWQLWDSKGLRIADADVVVVATAFQCKRLEQTKWIPLFQVRGQIQRLKPTALTSQLRVALSYGGYVTPVSLEAAGHVAGSTFDWKNLDPQPRHEDLISIVNDLTAVAPAFQETSTDLSDARVSFRATSPDTLPMMGRVPDPRHSRPGFLQYYEGLYTSVGHGSRGLLYTQLGGEILASMICRESLPLPESLLKHIAPERFLLRQWRVKSQI